MKLLNLLQQAIESKKCPTCGKPIAVLAGPMSPIRHRGHGYYAAEAYDHAGADDRRCHCNDGEEVQQ